MRKLLISFLMLFVLSVSSGCVYHASTQQGNFIKQDDLDQLEVGMTRKQVLFLLGTPMVADPFHQDRWDYVYFLKVGRDKAVFRRWVTVRFEEDLVAEILTDQKLSPDL